MAIAYGYTVCLIEDQGVYKYIHKGKFFSVAFQTTLLGTLVTCLSLQTY